MLNTGNVTSNMRHIYSDMPRPRVAFVTRFQQGSIIHIYIYDMRAIGVSHTACKDEFRRNLRSHSWSVFSFFIIYISYDYSIF